SCFSRAGITRRRAKPSREHRCGSRSHSTKHESPDRECGMKTRMFVSIAALTIVAAGATAQQTASHTRAHVETLASERFEGRLAGSNGERLAATYIVSQLDKIGAKPLPGRPDFLLPFEFTAGSRDGGSSTTVGISRVDEARSAGGGRGFG